MKRTYFISKILDRFHKGWITSFSLFGQRIDLPFSTRVFLLKNLKDGQLVKIVENRVKNEVVKIPYLSMGFNQRSSFLSNKNIVRHKLILRLKKKSGLLALNNKQYRCAVDESIPKGDYVIRFPLQKLDVNPKLVDENVGGSRFATTWFPIETNRDSITNRFLHFGSFSKGCITVKSEEAVDSIWPEVYLQIILARINNDTLASLKIF